jgi:hypothetical protein
MTAGQKKALREAHDLLTSLGREMMAESAAGCYLEMMRAGKSSVVLAGNAQGLMRLAALLTELALAGKDGKHIRLSKGALAGDDKELELLYKDFRASASFLTL